MRKFLDYQLSLTEKGKSLHWLRPLVEAGDTFLYEAPHKTTKGPHIRDAIDVKRWMLIVVIALIPCILMAIWNTGLQEFVYSSGDYKLMNEYLTTPYFSFGFKDQRYLTIIKEGLSIILPLTLVVYVVGGFWEALFAIVRKHEISEGFLVTGILFVLILPPTIPLWMAALGVSIGVIFAKEVYGGSGMNIVNPALACRAFLFFGYPGKMSGNVWVGSNPVTIRESLIKMNQEGQTTAIDGYTQASKLAQFNITTDIKRIHVDAIATNQLGNQVDTYQAIEKQFHSWNGGGTLGELSGEQLRSFVTTPLSEGGLGLSPGNYEDAFQFSNLNYGLEHNSDWNFFIGDKLGSIGETSVLACLLGALFLIYTGVGAWRTMVGMALGAYITALFFEWGSRLGIDAGAWNPAVFGFPAYKHLLLGGLAFGLVFMATDPVSSPVINSAKWVYGLFCGMVTVVIRVINPAFPEGVMLAILMGNVFAPFFDYYAANLIRLRRKRYVRTAA